MQDSVAHSPHISDSRKFLLDAEMVAKLALVNSTDYLLFLLPGGAGVAHLPFGNEIGANKRCTTAMQSSGSGRRNIPATGVSREW
jgi:hypothetical protein